MNNIHRKVWNPHRGAFMVVAENAPSRGKRSGTSGALLASVLVVAAAAGPALAAGPAPNTLPVGAQVTAGQAQVGHSGNTLTVTQDSQKAAINWQSFSIGADAAVSFVQPNAAAVALNRVTGREGSVIDGALQANGQVFILNPNGVLFGKGARVDTAGLVATTLGLTDADFMAGRARFTGSGGSVVNNGSLNARDGGYVALIGSQVKNDGVITARLGTVALAAGNKVSLNFNGDALVGVTLEEGALDALVANGGAIRADGGLVLLTAKAAEGLLGGMVNNTGEVRAQTISEREGKIFLLGDMQQGTVNVGGTLDASAPNGGSGGFIETSAAHVKVEDTVHITAASAQGTNGQWLIDPTEIVIASTGGSITGATIAAALATTSVTLDTTASGACTGVTCTGMTNTAGTNTGNGNITVNDDITVVNNTGANTTFTLLADRSITWNSATLDATNGAKGVNVVLTANRASTDGDGQISLGPNPKIAVIKTNGGNVTVTALGVNSQGSFAVNAAVTLNNVNIDAGAGAINIHGTNTNTGIGTYDSRHGIALESGNATNTTLQASSITMTGENNNPEPGGYLGISMAGGTYIATGTGGITVNGLNSTATGYGIGLRSYSDDLINNFFSATGPIAFNSTKVGLNFDNTNGNYGLVFGAAAGSSSAANVSINTDSVGSLGKMTINTSGIFTLQNYTGASFSTAVDLDFSGLTISKIGGLVAGKAGNTANLTLNLPEINGPITVNSTTTTLNSNLTSTIGDVTLNTALSKISPVAVTARAGNIVLNGDITTTDSTDSAIVLNAGEIKSAGDAMGGNIVIGTPVVLITGTGGRSTLFTGSVAGSIGLTKQIGSGSGNFRYNSDELDTNYSAALGTGTYAIYREQPTLTTTAVSSSKIYDGLAYLAPITADTTGFVNGDTQSVIVGALVYGGVSDAGSYTPSGYSTGLGYALSYGSGSLTITARPVTVTPYNTAQKVYDGSTALNSNVMFLGNLADNDNVTLSGSGVLAGKDAGTRALTGVGSLALDDSNYTLVGATLGGSAIVAPRLVEVAAINGASRAYDGTTAVTADLLQINNIVSGDSVVLSGRAPMSAKDVGTRGLNRVSGLSVDNPNYTLDEGRVTGTVAITALPLNISTLTDASRVYDGSTDAASSLLQASNVVSGDALTLSGTAVLAARDVGSRALTGLGSLAINNSNYTLAGASLGGAVGISARPVDLSTFSASAKVYDGTDLLNNEMVRLTNTLGGDVVTMTGQATLASANAGVRTLTGPGTLTLSDPNYTLVGGTVSGTANIYQRLLDLSTVSGAARAYDGGTQIDSFMLQMNNVVSGDVVNLAGTATLASKNVGDRAVSRIGDLSVDNPNYTLDEGMATGTVAITPRSLNLDFAVVPKVFDGSAGAVATAIDNRIAGDVLSANFTAAFGTTAAANGKPVNINGLSLAGTDAANYVPVAAAATGNITARPITLTVSLKNPAQVLTATGQDLFTQATVDQLVTAAWANTVTGTAPGTPGYTIWRNGQQVAAIREAGTYEIRPGLAGVDASYQASVAGLAPTLVVQAAAPAPAPAPAPVPVPVPVPVAAVQVAVAQAIRTEVPMRSDIVGNLALAAPRSVAEFNPTAPNVVAVSPSLNATFGTGANLRVVSAPGGNELSQAVGLSQARGLMQSPPGGAAGSDRDVRVPVSRNSLAQIVNGGVRLPGGVDQLLFVVADATDQGSQNSQRGQSAADGQASQGGGTGASGNKTSPSN